MRFLNTFQLYDFFDTLVSLFTAFVLGTLVFLCVAAILLFLRLLPVLALAAALPWLLAYWMDHGWVVTTVSALILLSLMWWTLRRATAPVRSLMRALAGTTSSYRDGEYNFGVYWPGNDELGDLVQAHRELGDVLREQRQGLVQRELLLDTMVQNTPVAMVLLDPVRRVVLGNLAARKLLLASGIADQLPALPGLAERWGSTVLHCPYCHGWEVRDQAVGGVNIAQAFYGVLAYYAIMLGTARWWLPLLAQLARPIPWLLAGLPVLWILWQVVPHLLPVDQLQSLLEWPRLMLVAGYNVFKMSAVAVGGMAIGLWVAGQPDTREVARLLLIGGGLGMAVTALSLLETNGAAALASRGSSIFTSLPGLIFYLSFAAFGTGLFLRLMLSWDRLPAALRNVLKLLLVIGGLALPIYVFHGLVIPGKDMLDALGLGGGLALGIPVGLFLLVMAYLGRRLWRMYFD